MSKYSDEFLMSQNLLCDICGHPMIFSHKALGFGGPATINIPKFVYICTHDKKHTKKWVCASQPSLFRPSYEEIITGTVD